MNAAGETCVPPVPRGEGRAAAFSGDGAVPPAEEHPSPGLDHSHFRALREISRNDALSQRELAGRMGVSLGHANFVVNSLIRRGLIVAKRFKNSRNRLAHRYVLTPAGVSEKVLVARRFLQAKLREYELLAGEIDELRRETAGEPADRIGRGAGA